MVLITFESQIGSLVTALSVLAGLEAEVLRFAIDNLLSSPLHSRSRRYQKELKRTVSRGMRTNSVPIIEYARPSAFKCSSELVYPHSS